MPETSEEKTSEERINLSEFEIEKSEQEENEHVHRVNYSIGLDTDLEKNSDVKFKFFKKSSYKRITRSKKLPSFKISRGLLLTIIFFILFCGLIIWFIRDFEDDQFEFHHYLNITNSTAYIDQYEVHSLPIQYVLAVTALIVALIVASVFVLSIAHHIRSKKERLTLDSFKSQNLKDIFASHRTQHRSPLYYLNQDMSVYGVKINVENSVNIPN